MPLLTVQLFLLLLFLCYLPVVHAIPPSQPEWHPEFWVSSFNPPLQAENPLYSACEVCGELLGLCIHVLAEQPTQGIAYEADEYASEPYDTSDASFVVNAETHRLSEYPRQMSLVEDQNEPTGLLDKRNLNDLTGNATHMQWGTVQAHIHDQYTPGDRTVPVQHASSAFIVDNAELSVEDDTCTSADSACPADISWYDDPAQPINDDTGDQGSGSTNLCPETSPSYAHNTGQADNFNFQARSDTYGFSELMRAGDLQTELSARHDRNLAPPIPISRRSSGRKAKSPGGFPCDYLRCGKVYDRDCDLTRHKNRHKPKTQWPHQCSVCGERFQYPKDVTRHQRKHNGDRVFNCGVCKQLFTRDDNRLRHQRLHSERVSESSVATGR